MSMSKKDYVALADALRSCRVAIANGYPVATNAAERERDAQRAAVHRAACYAIADACARGNPNFKRSRFIDACGIREG